MASVQDRAKAAAWAAIGGRNPLSPLSDGDRATIRAIVQSVVHAEGANLQREQQRRGAVGEQAQISLNTLQLSSEARKFLDDLINGEKGGTS